MSSPSTSKGSTFSIGKTLLAMGITVVFGGLILCAIAPLVWSLVCLFAWVAFDSHLMPSGFWTADKGNRVGGMFLLVIVSVVLLVIWGGIMHLLDDSDV